MSSTNGTPFFPLSQVLGPPKIAPDSLGSMLVVGNLSLLLFGFVIIQAYTYFTTFTKDRLWLKCSVAFVFVLDLIATIVTCLWEYYLLVESWGEPDGVPTNWMFALEPFFAGIMAFTVQLFFAWRIRVILENWIIPSVIVFFAFCSVIAAMVCIEGVSNPSFFPSFTVGRTVPVVWLMCSALVDMAITVILTWSLRRRQVRTAVSDKALDRIVKLTIQNGLLTSIFAITDLVLFLSFASPGHTVTFLVPKLYSVTVLSSLNARSAERQNPFKGTAVSDQQTAAEQGQIDLRKMTMTPGSLSNSPNWQTMRGA